MENINYEELRKDLINYFGTAASFNPAIFQFVGKVEKASNEQLIGIALKYGYNISDYKYNKSK